MSSILNIAFESLEIMQVLSCLCPCFCQGALPCMARPLSVCWVLYVCSGQVARELELQQGNGHGGSAAVCACRTLAQS